MSKNRERPVSERKQTHSAHVVWDSQATPDRSRQAWFWPSAVRWWLLMYLPTPDPGSSPKMLRWAHLFIYVSSTVSEGGLYPELGNGSQGVCWEDRSSNPGWSDSRDPECLGLNPRTSLFLDGDGQECKGDNGGRVCPEQAGRSARCPWEPRLFTVRTVPAGSCAAARSDL